MEEFYVKLVLAVIVNVSFPVEYETAVRETEIVK